MTKTPHSDEHELKQALGVVPATAPPLIEEDIQIEVDSDSRDRQDDDQFLARFFGFCLFMVGVITLIPGIYYLMALSGDFQTQTVPRWAYLVAFASAVHLLYALYVYQIADYSALQALSAFLLLVTCIYGFVGVAILLDESGPVAMFLQIPSNLVTRAAIWSGIMFSISALCCYVLGRESLIWRRKQNQKSMVN